MDKLNQSLKNCHGIENNTKIKRKILRDKYWNVTSEQTLDNGICCYKKLKEMKKNSIDFPTAEARRCYRKMILVSKLPLLECASTDDDKSKIFDSSSAGIIHKIPLSVIPCTYTDRLLKPFIFQDFEIEPLWLKMHCELFSKVSDRFPYYDIKKHKKHPVNYMYIQKEHIAAINTLAEVYFWPGIDVSSALWYPEFSCVALYKKIVIGFGIMTPGLHLNEGYINFLFVRPHWRGSGIATFILYHLTQTCISWNITLHTSLSNDAILLYNKFTFKVHKMIRDFYDERIPLNSSKSGHAFNMQLQKYSTD